MPCVAPALHATSKALFRHSHVGAKCCNVMSLFFKKTFKFCCMCRSSLRSCCCLGVEFRV